MPLVPPTTTAVRPDKSNSFMRCDQTDDGRRRTRARRGEGSGAGTPACGCRDGPARRQVGIGRRLLRLVPARLEQVIVHRAPRRVGVARADGLVDAAVHLGGVAEVALARGAPAVSRRRS